MVVAFNHAYIATPIHASLFPLPFFSEKNFCCFHPHLTEKGRQVMSPLCNSSATVTAALHQLLSLFMADTLTFFSFLSHHPLHLIYLLLSIPYLLPILSFLSPLLLSTSLLLLLTLLITTSPLTHHHHHPHSLLALLTVLKHNLDDKDPSASLMVIANELLQALLGNPETTQLRLSDSVEHAGRRVLKQRSMSVGGPEVLQRDGSMRKEKEWKRTLACKLYEERITFKLCDKTAAAAADKGEEMDLLWEAYEYDNDSKGKKDGDRMSIVEQQQEEDKRSEVDDDEEVMGKLCCLQALRMSTRKMNLRGVGATNLVKVSRVLKGIGLFQGVGGSRRGSSRNKY